MDATEEEEEENERRNNAEIVCGQNLISVDAYNSRSHRWQRSTAEPHVPMRQKEARTPNGAPSKGRARPEGKGNVGNQAAADSCRQGPHATLPLFPRSSIIDQYNFASNTGSWVAGGYWNLQ